MKNAGLLLLQKSRESYARTLHKLLLFTSCLTLLTLSSYQSKATQVTGTLTVDPSGTASATVFKDLNSVINYLTSATARPDGGPANAAPYGVSGPLLININAGTYYEQVDIPAITGASASNTITFKGAGAVNTIVNCTTATTSLRHTIRLNSTSWVIVRDMTIRGTSASGFAWPVHFMGSTNNSRLAGCTVDFGNIALSTQTSDNYTAVVMNSNASGLAGAGTFNNIDIDSNYMIGGNNGIYATGTATSSIMIRVRKNISDSSNRYGMYFTGIGELKCLDNTVQNRISSTSVTDGTGIYVFTCSVQAGKNHEIRNNKVMNAESYGIHLQSNTLVSTPRSAVTGNVVGGSFRNNNATGIFLNTYPSSMVSTWDVFFNSVNIAYAASGATAAAICVQTCCSQEIDIRNNNLLISNAASSAVPLRSLTWGFGNSTLTLNSNNYFKRGQGPSTVLIDNAGATYTVSTFVNGGGYNSTSISKDPLFVSTTNLYPGTPCNNGVLISGYTTDINGATRAATPDMGAYEYTASANDAGVTAIVGPVIPLTPGTQNVTLTLTNLGSAALTSATVSYQLNGGAIVSQNWTGNLAACASTNVVFSGAQAITIVAGNSYSLKAFSSTPNASADGNSNNDSVVSSTFGTALTGNYTIDPSGSGITNFTTFGAAAAALSNGGVSGPVVFSVAGGTYPEQVTIPQISGSSATNTITFNGGTGNAATRTITYAGTASAPHTLKLENASYISILNLTILGTSNTNGWPLHLMNTNFVTVRNCSISFTGTGLTSSSQNFIPLVANGSASTPSASGTVTNLVVENNTISGGYAGIYVYGLTSTIGSANHYLNSNNINNCSSYGIYDYYTYIDQEMKNNTISMRVGNANGYGIYIVAAQSPAASFEYTGNIIKDAGQYGIYLSSLAGSAAFPAFIANNMIGGGFVSGSSYGIYLNSCNYTNVWHNSVNLDAANMGVTLAALYLNSTNNADIRNNNLAVTGTNSLALPLITASSTFIALDYNNYYRFTNPVQLININGALYSSTNLFGAGGYNANSRVTNPMYTNAKDLHTGLKCNTGISISAYPVDVDGNNRSNPPGIGADENTNSNTLDLAVESISSPSVPVAAGNQNITVLIRNNGSTTITSANISYKVNNGTPVTQAWTGSLAPCATAVVTFTGGNQYNFSPSTAYTLLAYSDQPNAAADNATVNDTARLTVVATGMSGNFTIDGTIPASATNFQTFATAITAMTANGISGPVNFTVAPATYAVQVVIPGIPGATSTNTVTFDGGANASTVILSFSSSTSSARHTLRFDAANWIRIRNMSIVGSGTFAWPVHINTGASNLQIRNCLISCTQTLTNQTSTNYAGIVISSSATSLSGSSLASNIDIDSNTITNGWYGISFYGSGTTGGNPGINIRKNKIDSAGIYGINLNYAMGVAFTDNNINMRMSNGASTGSYGIYLSNTYTTATENIQVNRNKITGSTQYGIFMQTTGALSASTQRAQLINNAIGGGFTSGSASGIYFASANYWDVLFNTVNIDNAATGTAQCIYLTTGSATFNDIRNNNFAVTHASASGALPYRSVSGATVNALNYNNYFKAGATASTNIISVLGANYTPSTFTGANGGGANSIAQNPSFTSSTNLLPTVSTNKGISLLSVPADIVGTYRNVPPDLGAYEIPSTALTDLAIMKLNSPDTTLPVGSYNVSVTVRNFGSTPVTSFNLRHTVNGINMQDTAITGINLAQNAAIDVNMGSGKQATFGPSANTLKVYIHQPNGSTDGLQTNDSVVIGPRFPSMNGVYTINPVGSGPSNFTTFNAAVTAINSGGVSGPVIFNVVSGTFAEQIVINALNGTSATNTVRFVGNGTANTTLSFGGAAAPNQHTVRLNGSNWVSFENMTISGGGTTSNWVVHLLNASNCTIKKCKISLPAAVTAGAFINILANNSTATNGETTTSTLINNNVIDSNTIENGYYGLMLSNGNGANMNYIRGNTFTNCYYSGVYFYFQQGFKFNGNTISMRPGISNSYGINSFISTPNSPAYSEIRNNIITNAGYYGIYLNSVSGSGGSPYGEIINNMIGGGFSSSGGGGVYMSSCNYWKVWHNTINYDAVGNTAALNVQNGSLNDIRNNVFAIRNASATLAVPVILSTTTAASVFNYNNFYNAATPNLLNIAGNVYTAANYTAAFPNGAGINSRNLNPNFTSATNLHIGEACMNGENLGITTDIDGNARGTTPDMGADEMTTVPALDASVVKVNSPAFPFVAGTQPVNITIQNNGNSTLTGLTLAYSVNGSAPVTQSWTGSLASCDTMNFAFSSAYNFSSGPNVVKVYVASPNGSSDANTLNDTISTVPLCTGLSGTYTINPAGAGATNFINFSSALSALNCGGLAGPVVFNIANGTYNEQINLPSIQGASATNTITFQSASGNASAVTVSYSPGAENYVMNLNSTDYLIVKNITLLNSSTGGSYFSVLQISNSANNNTFRGCIFTNSFPTNGSLVYSVNTTDNNNTFVMNTFNGGSYGIQWQSNTAAVAAYALNLVIDSNTFTNQYNYGVYVYYCNGTKIRNNTITSASTTTYYGISLTYNYQNAQILNNNIVINTTASIGYGISMTGVNNGGNASVRALVANNMVKVSTGTSNNYGIFIDQYLYFTDVIHNTVNVLTTGAGISYAISINTGNSGYTADNCTFANNIFQVISSSASSAAFYHNSTPALSNVTINHNNYFVSTGNIARFQGAAQTTLASWKTAYGAYNVNSLNKRVSFAGNNDLHHSTPCLDNVGSNAYLTLVDKDIDGQNRNAGTPDIGADEFTSQLYDISVSRISAPTGYSASAQTVKAWIVNNGTTTITSANVGYRVNGGAAVTQNFTGISVAACDSAELTFTTQISTPTGYSVLQAFVSGGINGANADGVSLNDTTGFAFCTSLAGNFTINSALSLSSTNFQSVGGAVSAMKSCGLSGPVTFTIAPGTYNEQVVISNIPGVSASNTITFDGIDSSNRIIQYGLAGNTNRYVIMIDSCRYVTFKNLKIVNNSTTYGWGILVRGTTAVNNSDFVTIRKCAFVLPYTATNSYAAIVLANSFTGVTTATNYVQNITIDSNTFTGSYYGICINGVSTAVRSFANAINNNVFYNTNYQAIYAQNTSDLKVNRNAFYNVGRSVSINASATGIYLSYADSFEVTKNKIYGIPGGYGLYAQNCAGVSGSPNMIVNNMMQVGEGSNNGQVVFLISSPFTSIYYNSLHGTSTATNTSNCALYAQSSNNLVVVNNNLSTLYNTSNYVLLYSSSTVTQSDYNNYFGGTYYNGQGSVNAFKNTLYAGNDANSKNINPGYVSINDLHTPTNTLLDSSGLPIASITDDIDGQLRGTIKSDIGADEFSAPTENTGVVAIINPTNPITAGANEVHVIIKNFGASVLTSDSVIYQVGSTTHRRFWTGSLTTNAVDTVRFTLTSGPGNSDQRYTFPSGSSTIKAWTAYPNGIADVTNSDDTLTSVVCTGYAGTYTINPAGSGPSNFTSFTAAANALQCGITAPVTFNVSAGTYNEQFVINPIPGSSSTNTVLFKPANGLASSVIVQSNSSAVNNYVARLAGADYVTFDKLTFTATNASYGMVIEIVNYNAVDKPGNINITNCFINGSVQSTSAQLNLINALVETPNLVISGNTFTRGAYAVNIAGSSTYPYTAGIQITNNIFGSSTTDAPYYFGVAANYTRHTIITGNVFTGPNYNGYNAISLQSSSGKVKINNNRINASGGGNGIVTTFVNTNFETDSGEIINNSIAIGGTSTSVGMFIQYSANFNIYHNSINNYSTSTSTYAFKTYSAGTNYRKNRLQNNLLISTAGYAFYIEGNNTANAIAVLEMSNNNNFYTAGTNLAFVTTTGNISNLAGVKNLLYSGSDSSSVSGDPVFTTSSNLVPTSCKPGAVGIALTGITTDLNNVTRKALPDMGAYEFTPALAAPTVTSPVNLCYGSTATALTANSANTKLWFATASGGAGSTTASVPNTSTRITQTYYVADSSSTSGCISNRAAITVNIDTAVTNNSISSAQSICSGSTPTALTGSAPTGGNGTTYTYSWLSSTTSATAGFAVASGTNNASGYAPAALTANTWYKRVITSGACGKDSSAAVAVTVTAAVSNNSISSSPQTICSGSTPTAMTASTPTGGDGSNYTYSWLSSTTSATAGFAVASGTNNASGYAPGTLSASTWYRRVVSSGTCAKDTTAAVKVTVTNTIATNTISSSPQTICSGSTPTAITGSTPTGGDGTTYTYSWLSSTTSATAGFAVASGTNNASGYAPGTLSANIWYRRVVTSGACANDTTAAIKITITNAIATNTITSSPQTICAGSTPSAITASTATGGDGTTYTYSWLSSTTSATAGFAVASGTNNTSGYAPGALSTSTWFRRVVTSGACANDTTAAIAITVNTPGFWMGNISSAWNNTANWACPQIPTSTTDVTITAFSSNMPVITDDQVANNISLASGTSLTLNNANSVLRLYGNVTGTGTFTNTNGKVIMQGSAAQTIKAGTYNKVQINNSNGVSLGGAVTLNDTLFLTSGVVTLNANNLTLGNASHAVSASTLGYIKTNGTGRLVINNVGTAGKTGNVSIPVGNSTYNPVVLNNTGTADSYTVWVIDSVTNTYSGSTPSGAKLTSNAVNRTWIINETVAGGSNASVTLQWSLADELPSFTRNVSYVARHTGTVWNGNTASAASGANPYTQVRTGITSFSPFGVGSNGALPVEMLSFTGSKQQTNVVLKWSTASEKNNKGFDVERSADGKTWSRIEFVKGNGNSNLVNNYSYTDVNAFGNEKALFYRLKQVDIDGAYAYTNSIVLENIVVARVNTSVQPNPFNSNLQLNISSPVSNDATVTVTDMTGKLISIQHYNCNEGDNTITINGAETLKAGMYFVTVKIGTEISTHKVVKQ